MNARTEGHVSILGVGDMARGLGKRLSYGGASITFYGRSHQKAQVLAHEVKTSTTNHSDIHGKELGESLDGDIVILAVPYTAVFGIIELYRGQLADKILVDISNPLNFTTFELLTEPGTSAAENISRAAPSTTRVVKAFNTIFANDLGNITQNTMIDMPIASDSPDAKKQIAKLSRASGLNPIDAGPLKKARDLEKKQALRIKRVMGK